MENHGQAAAPEPVGEPGSDLASQAGPAPSRPGGAPVVPLPPSVSSPPPSQAMSAAPPAKPREPELSDLLRLPDAIERGDPVGERLRARPSLPSQTTASGRRSRIEVDRREAEALGVKRESVKLEAATDVNPRATVRGGVAVDREDGRQSGDPVPSVGVDVRF